MVPATPTPAGKPRLSFWQIWNMSFGFLGIQFGFALQNANVSRIFETLGADVDQIPILWIAAPLTGLIVQPIIGHWSDRTWTRLGRRRPFFLVGAILATIALFLMPNSPTLWIAAGMLWIMDASINVSMEPFRAFVGDNLPDSQRTAGFAMQSFFIGVGAVVASFLPYMLTNWLGMDNTAPEGQIADSVKWSFYLGGGVFLLAVLWTVLRSREYSPEQMAAFEAEHAAQSAAEAGAPRPIEPDGKRPRGEMQVPLPKAHETGFPLPAPGALVRQGLGWLAGGTVLTVLVATLELGKKELYIVGLGGAVFGLLLLLTAGLIRSRRTENGFVEVMGDLTHMPKTMRQLAVVQFFSWFALFAMWIYSTSAISRHYYAMDLPLTAVEQLEAALPGLPAEDRADLGASLADMRAGAADGSAYCPPKVAKAFVAEGLSVDAALRADLERVQKEYNRGGDWVGVVFAVYNGVAAIVAFLLPLLARRINRRRTHLLCMLAGGLGLASVFAFRDPDWLILSMVGVGIAWASILSMPYAILSGALPLKKMGVYMGIFNFFIVIPQLVAASILGFLVLRFFGNDPIWALLVGGFSMVLAGLLTLRVEDRTDAAA
jgi:maltose/moltooligosaccharide transporter